MPSRGSTSTGRPPLHSAMLTRISRWPRRSKSSRAEPDFQDFSVGGGDSAAGLQQADSSLLDDRLGEFFLLHDEGDSRFAGVPHGEPHLKIRHGAHGLRNGIDAQIKMSGAEAVVKIAQDALPAVHGAGAPVGSADSSAEPFEVAAFAPVNVHVEEGRDCSRRSRCGARLMGCASASGACSPSAL